jgi:hypothetical protein
MKKKKFLIRVFIVFLVAFVIFFVVSPRGRWILGGWWHGDRFYQGLPTSFWSGTLQRKADPQQWPPNHTLPDVSTQGGNSTTLIEFTSPPLFCVSFSPQPLPPSPGTPPRRFDKIEIQSLQDVGNLASDLFQPKGDLVPDEKDPNALPVLLQLLHYSDANVQLNAVLILGCLKMDTQEAVPHLQQLLRDGTLDVGREAAFVLCRIRNTQEVISQLEELLENPRAEVRQRAIAILHSIGRQAMAQSTPPWDSMIQPPSSTTYFPPRPFHNWATDKVISILSHTTSKDPEPDVRKAAAQALKSFPANAFEASDPYGGSMCFPPWGQPLGVNRRPRYSLTVPSGLQGGKNP